MTAPDGRGMGIVRVARSIVRSLWRKSRANPRSWMVPVLSMLAFVIAVGSLYANILIPTSIGTAIIDKSGTAGTTLIVTSTAAVPVGNTVIVTFSMDKSAALPLPIHAFDPCIREPKRADKYQTIVFDNNRYRVPRRWAFQCVTVKAYVDRIEIVADHQVVARHGRCYGRNQQVLEPVHYLVTLGRRPGALDHSGVYRNWQLPATFTHLRTALEERHGPQAGSRQYIRVLQLLAEHPQVRVQQADVALSGPGQGLFQRLPRTFLPTLQRRALARQGRERPAHVVSEPHVGDQRVVRL